MILNKHFFTLKNVYFNISKSDFWKNIEEQLEESKRCPFLKRLYKKRTNNYLYVRNGKAQKRQ